MSNELYDFNEKAAKLIRNAPKKEKDMPRYLKNNKTFIHEISEECKKTGIFKVSINKYNLLKEEIDSKYQNKALLAYSWFLNRIGSATNAIEVTGCVILTIPLIDEFLMSTAASKGSGVIK